MIGKDLILFIIGNDLTNVEIIPFSTFRKSLEDSLITEKDAACKLGIGVESLHCMYELGLISGVRAGENLYFAKDIKLPKIK